LEQEAQERAVAEKAAVEARLEERKKQEEERGKKFGGRPPQVPDPEQAKPKPKAQRNFTDEESRIMLDGATKSILQGYNAQIAVDSHSQIIVAAALTQEANDKQQLAPMLAQVEQNLGRKPAHATADTGYFSEAALADPRAEGIDLLVPPERQKHSEVSGTNPAMATDAAPRLEELTAAKSAAESMREKLSTDAGKAVYKMRKAVVEPVFGQIKEVRGLRRLSMRSLEKVAAEWQMICLTHNLLKLFRAGLRLEIA
jgi:hypothetical protein